MSEQKDFVLLLDASTEVCSTALGSLDGKLVAEEFLATPQQQSEQLAPMAQEVKEALPAGGSIVAVGLSEGPGSYTGLRIGASYAKGLCFALGIPMVSIPTPELMTLTLHREQSYPSDALFLPMIDARRMEVYTALYDAEATPLTEITALILTEEETQTSLQELVGEAPLYFFGSGAEKAQELFSTLLPQARFVPDIYPRAGAMLGRAIGLLGEGNTNDVAYWEPLYLKEYEAKRSQNKVLSRLMK